MKTNLPAKDPLASVIMSVYNGEKYLEESVKSILDQTYEDFEFIIVNDASTDETASKLDKLKDPRIKVFVNKSNLGNHASRNIGIRMSRGQFIFIMDADDIALPNRIEIQLSYMLNHPEVGICSSAYRTFGQKNETITLPNDYETLKIAYLHDNHSFHPGRCLRRDLFNGLESLLYDEKYKYASDYDYVARNIKSFIISNLPEVLMEYRVHKDQISSLMYSEQQIYADQIRVSYLSNINLFPDEAEKKIHLSLINKRYLPEFTTKDYLRWCNKILHYNTINPFFKNELLILFLKSRLTLKRF